VIFIDGWKQQGRLDVEHLWNFIANSENREIIAWIGGGLSTTLSAAWVIISYVLKKETKKNTEHQSADIQNSPQADSNAVEGSPTATSGFRSSAIRNDRRHQKWIVALTILGLGLMAYAVSLADQGDCISNSASISGDVSRSEIMIVGGSGDLRCR
jgi:hypothetical protein